MLGIMIFCLIMWKHFLRYNVLLKLIHFSKVELFPSFNVDEKYHITKFEYYCCFCVCIFCLWNGL